MAKHFASRNELENHVQIAIILKEHITNVQCRDRENTIQKTLQQNLCPKNIFYLNLPILLRWLNISPPGTYSIIMYKLELSCKTSYKYHTILKSQFLSEHTVRKLPKNNPKKEGLAFFCCCLHFIGKLKN